MLRWSGLADTIFRRPPNDFGRNLKKDKYNANPHLKCPLGADWQILSSDARPMILGGI
jgi:hypothetical protein